MTMGIFAALRPLRRAPVFAATVVATLALGTGVNIAVFAVVNATLLKPLPFGEPDRLVSLSESNVESGRDRAGVLPGSYLDWRERSRTLEEVALYWASPVVVTGREEPARVIAASVSPNFFELLAIAPALGRTFPSDDEAIVGHEREIVISHGLWQRWFGSDPGVLGQTVEVQGRVLLTVVGVMPPGLRFPRDVDFWRTEPWRPEYGRGDPERWREAVGRIRTGVSLQAAEAELQQLGRQLATEYPETNAGWTATVEPLDRALTRGVRTPLHVLLLAVSCLFLLTCVNVAALVLQRALGRQREWATRLALGADGRRLVRESLVEHGVMATAGLVTGALLSVVVLKQLVSVAPPGLLQGDGLGIDLRLTGYFLAVALTGIALTSALPVLLMSRHEAASALRSRAPTRGTARGWRLLVIAELAIAVVLLSSAGLMIRTMVTLQQTDLGLNPENVLATDIMLPVGSVTDPESQRPDWNRLVRIYRDLVEVAEADPQIERAALVAAPALAGVEAQWTARAGIVPAQPDGSREWRPVQHRSVTTGYFDVLRLPLVRGRMFSDRDVSLEMARPEGPGELGVAIVNRAAAEQLWPGADPLGEGLTVGGDRRVAGRIVVGISGDARDLAPDRAPEPTIYVPFAQSPDLSATLLTRAAVSGPSPASNFRSALRQTNAQLMIGEVRLLDERYNATVAPRRFLATVLTSFAVFAVLLAAVGLYGLMAASVTARAPEFAVRLAIGATRGHVQRIVLREAALVVGAGVTMGATVAWAGTRLLESQLFGIRALDPHAWIGSLAVLCLAGLAAAWLPARRGAHNDPGSVLRAG